MTSYRIICPPGPKPGRSEYRVFLASFDEAREPTETRVGDRARWSWTAVLRDALVVDGRQEAERLADLVERWQEAEGYTRGRVLQIVSTRGGYPVARPAWKVPRVPTAREYVANGCEGPGPAWLSRVVLRAGSRKVRPLSPVECAALILPRLGDLEGMPEQAAALLVGGLVARNPPKDGQPLRAGAGRPHSHTSPRRIRFRNFRNRQK